MISLARSTETGRESVLPQSGHRRCSISARPPAPWIPSRARLSQRGQRCRDLATVVRAMVEHMGQRGGRQPGHLSDGDRAGRAAILRGGGLGLRHPRKGECGKCRESCRLFHRQASPVGSGVLSPIVLPQVSAYARFQSNDNELAEFQFSLS